MMDSGGQCVMIILDMMRQPWPVENSTTPMELSAMPIVYFLPAEVHVYCYGCASIELGSICHLCVHSSVCLSLHPSIPPSVCQAKVESLSLSFCLSVYLTVCLSVCLSVIKCMYIHVYCQR